jgi:hypothetical protein
VERMDQTTSNISAASATPKRRQASRIAERKRREIMADESFVKIAFELQQDEDGYPPDEYETLWAVALKEKSLYRLDNIPLYVKGVSSEDVVLAEPKNGRLEFVRLVQPSTNSVYRVFVKAAQLRLRLHSTFCTFVRFKRIPFFRQRKRYRIRAGLLLG